MIAPRVDNPVMLPLGAGDPAELGGYGLLGRLGEGGQGVVYLAADRSGARVAVKWLHPGVREAGRFLREAEAARRVAPFCTAQVLHTGVAAGRPYLVSEYIPGASLRQVVTSEGPRGGAALHRLAIGTATALAAIHHAGVVHRDLTPANVILGADGPRVIDFGVARAFDATSTGPPVGTPAYMAPEQFNGETAGPPADLFSWAATMAYAASGRPPFGGETVPATIHRVLTADPGLDGLDGPLREVVLACLAKDPARRPTAEEVVLRLLRPEPGVSADAQEAVERREAVRRRRSPVAALVALAVVAFGMPSGGPPAVPEAVPGGGVGVALTGGAVVYEHPEDAIALSGYEVWSGGDWADYSRTSPGGPFTRHPGNWETRLSPDGRYLAGRGRGYTAAGYDAVTITDQRTGAASTVETVRRPLLSSIRGWSKRGDALLLSIERKAGDGWDFPGFVVVDVASRRARVVEVADPAVRGSAFGWDGAGTGVVGTAPDGLRFFDTGGRAVRTLPGVGRPASGTADLFSPSGAMVAATCPGGHCLWDTRTGERLRRLPAGCAKFLGWYDERHVHCWSHANPARDEVQVFDLAGAPVRLLLSAPKGLGLSPVFTRSP